MTTKYIIQERLAGNQEDDGWENCEFADNPFDSLNKAEVYIHNELFLGSSLDHALTSTQETLKDIINSWCPGSSTYAAASRPYTREHIEILNKLTNKLRHAADTLSHNLHTEYRVVIETVMGVKNEN